MSPALRMVIQTCLDRADAAPLRERVRLYRSLAEFCVIRNQAATLRDIADDLEATDFRCREFAFEVLNPKPDQE